MSSIGVFVHSWHWGDGNVAATWEMDSELIVNLISCSFFFIFFKVPFGVPHARNPMILLRVCWPYHRIVRCCLVTVWYCLIVVWWQFEVQQHISISMAQLLIPDHFWRFWTVQSHLFQSLGWRFRTTSATGLELAGARYQSGPFGTCGPLWANLQRSQLCSRLDLHWMATG